MLIGSTTPSLPTPTRFSRSVFPARYLGAWNRLIIVWSWSSGGGLGMFKILEGWRNYFILSYLFHFMALFWSDLVWLLLLLFCIRKWEFMFLDDNKKTHLPVTYYNYHWFTSKDVFIIVVSDYVISKQQLYGGLRLCSWRIAFRADTKSDPV